MNGEPFIPASMDAGEDLKIGGARGPFLVTLFGKRGAGAWVRHAYRVPAHCGLGWTPYRVLVQSDGGVLGFRAFVTLGEFKRWMAAIGVRLELQPFRGYGSRPAWVARFGWLRMALQDRDIAARRAGRGRHLGDAIERCTWRVIRAHGRPPLLVTAIVRLATGALSAAACRHCQDRPGFDGMGRMCKHCGGSGWKL